MRGYALLPIFLGVSLLQLVWAGASKCRVINFQGGGDLGAYEIGAFIGLLDSLPAQETEYDVISGVSAGAINAAALSMFPKGAEREAAAFLNDTWRTITAEDVYTEWPYGILEGIIIKPGAMDMSPLRTFLTKNLNQTIKRKLNIAASDLNIGAWARFNETLAMDMLIDAVVSSSSVPVVFPFQTFSDGNFMDGGIINGLDLLGGIERCLETHSPEDIIVDALYCRHHTINKIQNLDEYHVLGIYERAKQIHSYMHGLRAWTNAQAAYPDVNFRYKILPSKPLPDSLVPIWFVPTQADYMMALGYSDAVEQVGQDANLS